MTYSFSPAHTEWLQGRAVPTGTGMGSVNVDREEARGQRNKSQQGQLQAVQTLTGREGYVNVNTVAGEPLTPPSHALWTDSFPE